MLNYIRKQFDGTTKNTKKNTIGSPTTNPILGEDMSVPDGELGLSQNPLLQNVESGPTRENRMDRYYVMNGNICCLNTSPDVVWFYWWLTLIHWIIDKYHDQLASGRGDSLKSSDTDYRQRGLINNIIKSSVGQNIQFTAGSSLLSKTYGTDSGVHSLQQAFEREGDDFFLEIDGVKHIALSLPGLYIVKWNNCDRNDPYVPREAINQMVIYKQFDTPQGCDNTTAGIIVNNHAGINTLNNTNYGYVLDAGPSEVFSAIISGANTAAITGNGQSGKLDSSSSSGEVTPLLDGNIPEQHQSLVPFMNIYRYDGILFGPVMLYSTILSKDELRYFVDYTINIEKGDDIKNNHVVLLAFRLATFNTTETNHYNPADMYSVENMGGLKTINSRVDNARMVVSSEEWVHFVITTSVPELPSIAKYMAGNRGCFSYIKSLISGGRKSNLCEQYKGIAFQLFYKIKNKVGDTIFADNPYSDEFSDFVMAFLMASKCDGDQKRGLDAFVLSEIGGYSFTTGTIDGFLSRFLCLANLYVYCANKNGGNLTVNDVRELTQDQINEIKQKNEISKCTTLLNRFKHYKTLVLPSIDINDKIKELMKDILPIIKLIENGILNQEKIKLIIAARSGRSSKYLSVINSSNFYEYTPNKKIFSQEEMESIFKYYLVLLQTYIYLDLLLSNNDAIQVINSAKEILLALTNSTLDCNEYRTETIQTLEFFENKFGNLFNFLDKCYSIRYFIINSSYKDDSSVREVVNDFSKFFRMNICSESLIKLVENIIPSISLNITPIVKCQFEPNVIYTIESQTHNLYQFYNGLTIGGTKHKSIKGTRKSIRIKTTVTVDDTFKFYYKMEDYLYCILIANQKINTLIELTNNGYDYNIAVVILTEFILICKMLDLRELINATEVVFLRRIFSKFGGYLFGNKTPTSREDLLINVYEQKYPIYVNGFNSQLYSLFLSNLSNGDFIDKWHYNYPDYYDEPNEHNYSNYYNDYYAFISEPKEHIIINKPKKSLVGRSKKRMSYAELHGLTKNTNDKKDNISRHARFSVRDNNRKDNRNSAIYNKRTAAVGKRTAAVGGRKKSHRPRNINKNKTRKIK
jgi:hypothetical protein